jgi:polyisoprenoid-binding protein YceI
MEVTMKVLVFSLFAFGFSAFAAVDKYSVDNAHASVVFKINHMGFSNVYGMFGDVNGEVQFDEAKPDSSKMEFTIKADSVDTKNAKRDEHLRKPDFFDTKAHPTISFKSTAMKKIDGKTYDVKGDLSLHGVTKPISFKLTRFRTGKDPMGATKTGGEARFTIKRSEYGMKNMVGEDKVGDEVELMISMEGAKS